MSKRAVLDVVDLTTQLSTSAGIANAVDHLNFRIGEEETLALVGESGCGKSMTALSIMRLEPAPAARVTGGSIMLEGRDILQLSAHEMRRMRGKDIAMIFQEPMTSLNPVFTIGRQVTEGLREHEGLSRKAAESRAIELIDLVRLPDPRRIMESYPHRLSGGMRQRVMIAMAIACRPKLLIADEPTTALDVTVQAQILELLRGLQREFKMALLLITHDFGVVAEMADHVAVMYAGRMVESAPVRQLFHAPRHPYTQGLLAATPRIRTGTGGKRARLNEIVGAVPSLFRPLPGCSFQPRCPEAIAECGLRAPALTASGDGRRVACLVAAGQATAGGEANE